MFFFFLSYFMYTTHNRIMIKYMMFWVLFTWKKKTRFFFCSFLVFFFFVHLNEFFRAKIELSIEITLAKYKQKRCKCLNWKFFPSHFSNFFFRFHLLKYCIIYLFFVSVVPFILKLCTYTHTRRSTIEEKSKRIDTSFVFFLLSYVCFAFFYFYYYLLYCYLFLFLHFPFALLILNNGLHTSHTSTHTHGWWVHVNW